jgi:hypothetical protein
VAWTETDERPHLSSISKPHHIFNSIFTVNTPILYISMYIQGMFLSLTRFNSLEPGNVTCDFEESSGCHYAFGSHFVWREGYIHHLPSIDHTIGNESGMYIEIYNIGVLTVNIDLNM